MMANDHHSARSRAAAGPAVFLIAVCIGAFAWMASAEASGVFEPYDSGIGLLVNQIVLVAGALWVGLRQRPWSVPIFLAGAYVGLNAYPYAFGSSESREWAVLGAIASVLLLLAPCLCSLTCLAYRAIRRRNERISANEAGGTDIG